MRRAGYPQASRRSPTRSRRRAEAGGEPREVFEVLRQLGPARSHQSPFERALEAYDEALGTGASIRSRTADDVRAATAQGTSSGRPGDAATPPHRSAGRSSRGLSSKWMRGASA
jgi:hypothetical protein